MVEPRNAVIALLVPVFSVVTLALIGIGVPFFHEPAVLLTMAAIGLGYGLLTAILGSYDLREGRSWVALIVDTTWSLPNTVFGAVIGNLVYPFFGKPDKTDSEGKNWVVYKPRNAGGFGSDVLQTLGTINLGGTGQHERMHLLQARIFGPLYLPLFGAFYVVTTLLQLLFTGTLGLLLWKLNARPTPYLRPPNHSAVKGFFGWIYYATPFEVWAYAAGNP